MIETTGSMTPEEANRVLRDPVYLRGLVTQARERLEVIPIDSDFSDTSKLVERRGIVKALRLIENIFDQAEATLKAAAEEEEMPIGPVPGNLAAALLDPVPLAESE